MSSSPTAIGAGFPGGDKYKGLESRSSNHVFYHHKSQRTNRELFWVVEENKWPYSECILIGATIITTWLFWAIL